ncbi:hypothetical protein ACM1ZW_26785 [Pseudomonas sp. NFX71]|uniref:hypothetical protein n=1 Tax=Pseudomonas sp. NFX71 TaxID=3399121 RepID=UPI003A89C523
MTIQIRSSSAERAVYLCYGSDSHTLRIEGAEDSPWVSQGVSLNHASADSPLIFADPGYGELQKLEPEGSEWKLRCPADGIDHDFEYSIQSEFTAVPYKISVRLGHYRREVLDSRSPISAPVIGDTVKAQITVGSFYTKQALENIEVKWSIGGTTTAVPTSTSGVSQFTHTVQTLGEQTITAEFYSPYDDKTVSESFEIKVYETSPWEDAKLYVNDREVMWGDPIGLTRGRANALRVEVAPEIAKVLRLGVGESGGLDLVSNPPFESDVSPVGETFNWTVTPDDGLSGLGMLVLFSTDVVLPWELPFWVMSANLSDEVEGVWVDGVAYPVEGAVLFRDEPRTITLSYKAGSPVRDWPLELTATLLGGLEDGDLVVTSDGLHTWTIVASNNSGTFKLDLTGAGFTAGVSTPVSKVLSRNLADEATVQIDGKDAEPGTLYFRGGVHTLTLVPKAGSPIAGHGVGLWLGRSPLVTSNPPAETFTGLHSWTITLASDRSGMFHFELAGEHFGRGNIKIDANKLLSRDLGDEARVQIDGKDVEAGATYYRGEAATLTLALNPGSPLTGHEVGLSFGGSPLATSVPAPDTMVTDHSWALTFAADQSGFIGFEFAGNGMTTGIKIDANRLLSRNLDDEVIVLVDGVPMPSDGADFTGGQSTTLTLGYKTPGLLDGVLLALDWQPDPDLVTGDLTSLPSFLELSTRHEWILTGLQSKGGTFKLKLYSDEEAAKMLTPTNRLVARAYRIRFLELLSDGKYIELPASPVETNILAGVLIWVLVRVTEQDLTPVKGVSVTLDGVHTSETNANGFIIVLSGFLPGTYDYSAVATRGTMKYKETIRLNARLPTPD